MIGFFGGTFDPIHYGHLRSALEVYDAIALQELRFIPLHRAVHRAQPLAPAALRLELVAAAVRDQRGFIADGREIAHPDVSRTYDTVQSLRSELGAQTPLCLLIGGDAFNSLLDWYQPIEILQQTHVIVMQRPGAPLPRDPELRRHVQQRHARTAAELTRSPGGRILLQPVTQLAISATTIRGLIAAGKTARFLVPDAVLALIEQYDLYRESDDNAGSTA